MAASTGSASPAPASAATGGEDEPITIADAARRCGVHPNTVRRLIRRGTLGALMVRTRYGNTWLVSEAELRALFEQPRHHLPDAEPPDQERPRTGGQRPAAAGQDRPADAGKRAAPAAPAGQEGEAEGQTQANADLAYGADRMVTSAV